MRRFLYSTIILGIILFGVFQWRNSKLWDNYRYVVYRFNQQGLEIFTGESNPENLKIIRLPKDVWINTFDNRGMWKIESIPELAEKYGKIWEQKTIAERLANGIANSYSDISVWDKLVLWRRQRDSGIEVYEVDQLNLLEENIAPDGENIRVLSPSWEVYKNKLYLDSQVSLEESYVEVINASGVTGAGSRAADSIDMAGAHVFDVSASEEVIERCEVSASEEKQNSSLVNWMIRRFDCIFVLDQDLELIVIKVGKNWVGN